MTAREWMDRFAESLGVESPSDAELEALLDLAGVAAHASERIAAPITCWLVGRAGVDIAEARRVADELAAD